MNDLIFYMLLKNFSVLKLKGVTWVVTLTNPFVFFMEFLDFIAMVMKIVHLSTQVIHNLLFCL